MSSKLNFRQNKVIFNIDKKLELCDLEKLISNCEIDFFTIDTTCFVNVKEYQEMIENIHSLNQKFNKKIGVIVELRGRKCIAELVIIDNFNLKLTRSHSESSGGPLQFSGNTLTPLDNLDNIVSVVLKKGSQITITNHVTNGKDVNLSLIPNELNYEILIKFKNLHQMLKPGDQVIVNDNKCSLTVQKIIEHGVPNANNHTNNVVSPSNKTAEMINLKVIKGVKRSRTESNLEIMENAENINLKINEDELLHKINLPSPTSCRGQLDMEISNFYIKRNTPRITGREKLSSLFHEKKYEIVCTVDYDCLINRNFYLYFPSVDFKKYQVDVLSSREVAEISCLEKLKVNFLSILINDKQDINSLKEIIGEDSKLKILASISNIKHLDNISDILDFADGVVISRTFQIINKENKNKISRLTNFLIAKSIEFSKPVYSFIDFNIDLVKKRKKFITDSSLIMYNLVEGFDGFIVNIQNSLGLKMNIDEYVLFLHDLNDYLNYNYRTRYFENINKETENQFLLPYLKLDIEKDFFTSFLLNYTHFVENSIFVFIGHNLRQLRKFLRLRNKSPIVVISKCLDIVLYSNLFNNVCSILLKEETSSGTTPKNLFIKSDFKNDPKIEYKDYKDFKETSNHNINISKTYDKENIDPNYKSVPTYSMSSNRINKILDSKYIKKVLETHLGDIKKYKVFVFNTERGKNSLTVLN
jgi:pyruvate kinase